MGVYILFIIIIIICIKLVSLREKYSYYKKKLHPDSPCARLAWLRREGVAAAEQQRQGRRWAHPERRRARAGDLLPVHHLARAADAAAQDVPCAN